MAQLERRQVSVWCAGATRCRGRVLRVAEGPSLAARPVAQAPPRWRFRPNQRPEAAGPARRAPRGHVRRDPAQSPPRGVGVRVPTSPPLAGANPAASDCRGDGSGTSRGRGGQ